MADLTKPLLISHWYKLIEGLEASPMEFFAAVEEGVERRLVPDTGRSRIDHREGGVLSAKREYLRIRRGRLAFDVCAAPFGNGFFVSWWLGELRAGPIALLLLLGGSLLIMVLFMDWFGFLRGLFLLAIVAPVALWYMVRHTPEHLAGWDDPILLLPWIGPIYAQWIRPETYYKIDTALMFQSAVHAAVLEVVDGLTGAKGIRALAEAERKPILKEFLARPGLSVGL